MTTHVVTFTAPINSSTCGQLIRKCSEALNAEPTELILKITTMGGECSYAFTLYNFLRSLPIPVRTHNLGTVESMGNIIFLAGERRSACTHSKFLHHPFHWTLHGSIDHSRMAEYAMCLDYDRELYRQIVEERTEGASEPLDVHSYLTAAPRILDPQAALRSGMIQQIGDPELPGDAVFCSIHA